MVVVNGCDTVAPQQSGVILTVDDLAQEIRLVDGNNSLGSGALAEALMPRIRSALTAVPVAGEAVAWRVLGEPDLPVHFARTEQDADHLINNLLTYRRGCTKAWKEPLYTAAVKRSAGSPELPLERETLGRMVREAWVRWAQTQPAPKASWLVPYDELTEPDKEADRQIGEAIAKWTVIHCEACRALRNKLDLALYGEIRASPAVERGTDIARAETAWHAKKLRETAAMLAAERIQGWAKPLVSVLTDAADYLAPQPPPANAGGVVVSEVKP